MAVSIVLRNKPFTEETEDEIIEALRPSWIQGLSVLGGEPTEEESVAVLVPFLKRVRGELPGKDIWLYSGYTWEMLRGEEILSLVDVLVDGPFLKEQKHYREIEASHYLSWLIRQGKTVESISAYFHTDEDGGSKSGKTMVLLLLLCFVLQELSCLPSKNVLFVL